MSINRDRFEGTLKLSQDKCIGKVLENFGFQDAKIRNTPLGSHFNLTKKQSPQKNEDKKEMAKVLYASAAAGSVMYTMICTRPDIAYVMGVVSRYMSSAGWEH